MDRLKKFIEFLKSRWEIESDKQFGVICFVFAITGSCSIFARKYFLKMVGIDLSTIMVPFNYAVRISLTVMMYQVMLVIIGTIFGQFKFFWKFERRFLGRFIPPLRPKPQTSNQ